MVSSDAGEMQVLARRVRLFHVLAAIGMARNGSVAESRFEGSLSEGHHVFRLDADAWASSWSASGFASVDADHELLGPDAGDELIASIAGDRSLAQHARALAGGKINAVLWSGPAGVAVRGSASRFELLTRAESAVFDEEPHCLRELFGLQAGDLALARRLERAARSREYSLVRSDVAALLGTERRNASAIQTDAADAGAMLCQVGIVWPDPRSGARHHLDAIVKRAGPSKARELFEALAARRFETVLSMIQSGACDASARAPKGVPGVEPDEPLLVAAARARRHDVIGAAIAAGADLDARYGGYTAAAQAVEIRDAVAVRMLLEAGSKLTAGMSGQDSILRFARYHVDAEIIRLLLDAGAPLPDPRICRVLAAIATSSGAPDVAARLADEPGDGTAR